MRRRTFLAAAGTFALASCTGTNTLTMPDAVATNAYPPLGKLVDINGRKVHATDAGTGGPPVILIHGSNVNLRDWTYSLAGDLAKKRRVIAMDRPGYGYSERGPEKMVSPAKQGCANACRRQQARRRKADHRRSQLGARRSPLPGRWTRHRTYQAWFRFPAPACPGAQQSMSLTGLGIVRAGAKYYSSRLVERANEGAVEAFVARAFRPQTPPPGYLDYVAARRCRCEPRPCWRTARISVRPIRSFPGCRSATTS